MTVNTITVNTSAPKVQFPNICGENGLSELRWTSTHPHTRSVCSREHTPQLVHISPETQGLWFPIGLEESELREAPRQCSDSDWFGAEPNSGFC